MTTNIMHSKKCSPKKVMEHGLFMKRIKKTLYYGSSLTKCQTISRPLAKYAADIFSETHKGFSLNRLNFVTAGNVNVTPCSLILAIIYLDRLKDTDPEYARRITPTELFLVSMIVSTKFYCGYDEDIYLSAWAKNGNMSVESLKKLELEFLCALEWNAYVSNEEFFEKLNSVELSLASQEGIPRGWLTYTELTRLLPSIEIAKQILYYNAVMALSYAAGFLTIASAFFLVSHIPGNALYNKTHQLDKSTNTTKICCAETTINTNNSTSIYDIDNINSTIDIQLLEEDCNEIIDNLNLTINDDVDDKTTNFIQNIILSESLYDNNHWKYNYDIQYNCTNINNWIPLDDVPDEESNNFKNNIFSLFLSKFL